MAWIDWPSKLEFFFLVNCFIPSKDEALTALFKDPVRTAQ